MSADRDILVSIQIAAADAASAALSAVQAQIRGIGEAAAAASGTVEELGAALSAAATEGLAGISAGATGTAGAALAALEPIQEQAAAASAAAAESFGAVATAASSATVGVDAFGGSLLSASQWEKAAAAQLALYNLDLDETEAAATGAAAGVGTFAAAADAAAVSTDRANASLVTMGGHFRLMQNLPLLAGAAAAGASVALAAQLQDSMSKIEGLAGASHAVTQQMTQDVVALSTQVPQSANELAQGLYFVVSAGYQGADALNILDVSAKAAAAGLGSTQTVADAVTSVLNAYHESAGQASTVTDTLVEAVTEGKMPADQFAQSLGRVLPIAASAGVSFQEVAANMATMTRAGMSSDEAATALRQTIAELEKPSAQASKELAAIGLSAEQVRADIADKGLLATLQDMENRTHGNVDALSALFPNIRALTDVLATAGTQGESYSQILQTIQDSTGATDRAFTVANQDMVTQLKESKNVAEEAAIAWAGLWAPGAISGIHGLSQAVLDLGNALQRIKSSGPLGGLNFNEVFSAIPGVTPFLNVLSGIEGVLGRLRGGTDAAAQSTRDYGTAAADTATKLGTMGGASEQMLSSIANTYNPLADALRQITDSESQYSAATSDAAAITNRVGGAAEQMAAGVYSANTALQRTTDTLAQYIDTAGNWLKVQGAVDAGSNQAQAGVTLWGNRLKDAKDALAVLQDQQRSGTPLNAKQQAEFNDLTWYVGRLQNGLKDDLVPAFVDAQDQEAKLTQYHDQLNQAVKDGKITQDQANQALRDYVSANDPALAAAQGLQQAMDGTAKIIQGLTDRIHDMLVNLGLIPPDRHVNVSAPGLDDTNTKLDHLKQVNLDIDATPVVIDTSVPHEADTSAALQHIQQVEGQIDRDVVITVSANINPAVQGIAAIDAMLPHSPARTGPLSVLPNWGALFAGIGPAAAAAAALGAQTVDDYLPHSPAKAGALSKAPNWTSLFKDIYGAADSAAGTAAKTLHDKLTKAPVSYDWRQLFAGIPDAAGATAAQIAKALDDGVTAGALSAGDAAKRVTDSVLTELGKLYDSLTVKIDNLSLSGTKGAGDQIAKLRSQMDAIGQIVAAWSASTGMTVADALAADRHAQDILAGWKDLVGQMSQLFDGSLLPKLRADVQQLSEMLSFAQAEGAPQSVIDDLTRQLTAKETELTGAGRALADAIAKGIVTDPALLAAGKDAADVIAKILSATDPAATVRAYQETAKTAVEAYAIGLEEGLPPATIHALKDAADRAQAEATDAGKALADATAAGYLNAPINITSATLKQVQKLVGEMPDAGKSIVDAAVSALENGQLSMAQAASLFTAPMIAALRKVEQELIVNLAEALLKGTDPTGIEKNLKIIEDLLKRLGQSLVDAGSVVTGGASATSTSSASSSATSPTGRPGDTPYTPTPGYDQNGRPVGPFGPGEGFYVVDPKLFNLTTQIMGDVNAPFQDALRQAVLSGNTPLVQALLGGELPQLRDLFRVMKRVADGLDAQKDKALTLEMHVDGKQIGQVTDRYNLTQNRLRVDVTGEGF